MTTKTKSKAVAKSANKRKSGGGAPILAIVFAVIAVALIAAIVLSSEKPIGSEGEYGEPTITGTALPSFQNVPAMGADPAIGLEAPEIVGQDFDGSTVTVSADGTPKVVLFIAHWCVHCRAEVPRIQSWINSGGGVAGVDIISVTTAANSGQANWPPSAWLESEGWTQPNIRDDQANSALDAYGGGSFPYFVFLNGDGTVALRLAGETDVSTLETVMTSLQGAN